MFKLADGRQNVYQWDINVKLLLDESNKSADEVHFSARFSRISLSVEVVHTEDSSYVTIPNILLQKPNDIIAYSYITNADGSYTKYDTIIPVIARPKPSGYIYEETEILTWKSLDDKINDLGESTANSVKYTEQVLTYEQKAQARTNIGAVSVGEVPEQVQADMAQNDSTASDFVKNRTHYVEGTYINEIVQTMQVDFETYGDTPTTIWSELCSGESVEEGKEYTVYFDDNEYHCLGVDLDGTPFVGNPNIWEYGTYEDNGLPFCLYGEDGSLWCGIIDVGTNVTHTIKVETISKKIKLLDKEFLPPTIPYTENGKIPSKYIAEKFPDYYDVFDSPIEAGGKFSTLANPYCNKITISLSIEKFNSYLDGTLDLPTYCIIGNSIAAISIQSLKKFIKVDWMEFSIYGTQSYEISGAQCIVYRAKIHEDSSNPGIIVSEYAMIKIADTKLR